MCGIAGLIGRPDEGYSVARRLVAALRHRGPDDEGFDRPLSTVTLVHTRLAVLDLSSAGHQPMRDHPSDGRMSNCVVFNGEIFDYPDLARELAREGWLCRTRCDTEVILHAFRAWGPDCVDHLRGMFAFCLVDTQRGVAHLYRDRLGIKPMYLYRPHGGGLVFSSELRAILGLGAEIAPRSINARALESYFAQGAVQGYESLVEGVSMLRPSEHLALDVGNGKELVRRVYWDFNPPSDDEFDREDEVEKLRTLARQTVKLHLLSDAALGVFLSSGVDSTALLTMLREVFSGTLRTLTVGFDQKEYDEAGGAALVAKSLETDHTTLLLTGDAATTMLDESLSAMDQPTVDGFNTYFISRSARQLGLTVAVSGLGGDELFGGYASFTDVPKALSLRKYPIAKWPIDIASCLVHSRSALKLREVFRREPDLFSLYLLRRELFLPDERRALHPSPEGADPNTGIDQELVNEMRTKAQGLDQTNQISLFELQCYMRHMLLRDADVFSMAAPIEYRVPFLDHVLAEAIFKLPGSWKKPDPRPKPLLVDIAGRRMPSFVFEKPKKGFVFPWRRWLFSGGPLFERARHAAHDRMRWLELGICPKTIADVWTRFTAGEQRLSPLQVLALIALHHFASTYGLYRA